MENVWKPYWCSIPRTGFPNCELSDDLAVNDEEKHLQGKWKKITTAKCTVGYPDEIEFFERPRVLAKNGPGQSFIWWDAGSYEVTGPTEVTISIATDEKVPYPFSIAGDILSFVDRDGCEFQYR